MDWFGYLLLSLPKVAGPTSILALLAADVGPENDGRSKLE